MEMFLDIFTEKAAIRKSHQVTYFLDAQIRRTQIVRNICHRIFFYPLLGSLTRVFFTDIRQILRRDAELGCKLLYSEPLHLALLQGIEELIENIQ
jgi:hypothetical protein